MTSKRLFNGIAHDIAHHAQSGVSWLHPHIGDACRQCGIAEARLDLLSEQRWSAPIQMEEALQLGTESVRQKFRDMVAAAGLDIMDLAGAWLWLRPVSIDAHSTEVRSQIDLKDGRTVSKLVRVNWLL